jgi:hypothetical protein
MGRAGSQRDQVLDIGGLSLSCSRFVESKPGDWATGLPKLFWDEPLSLIR